MFHLDVHNGKVAVLFKNLLSGLRCRLTLQNALTYLRDAEGLVDQILIKVLTSVCTGNQTIPRLSKVVLFSQVQRFPACHSCSQNGKANQCRVIIDRNERRIVDRSGPLPISVIQHGKEASLRSKACEHGAPSQQSHD